MPYAQKNYNNKQGGGNGGKAAAYTIAQIGCFLVSFSNLLDRKGKGVDPATLNQTFINRSIFIDVDDGVKDDLGWGSITQYDPNVIVSRTGAGGWPASNDAIVCFRYQSVQQPWLDAAKTRPNMIDHFCLVADINNRTIIDSWDGQIKHSPYGEPTKFAEYVANSPQPVPPPLSTPPVSYSGKSLFLPAAAGTWRVYRVSGPYTVGHEIGKLTPGDKRWAPGLTYPILGTIGPNIFKIHTETFGDVAIYAGPDTIAQILTAAPPTPAAPAAPEKPKVQLTYAKLEAPIDLIVNKNPTNKWALDFADYGSAIAVERFEVSTPFRAFGKAQRTDLSDKPMYYMLEHDFGQADVTGSPASNTGINTLDLSMPPEPKKPEFVINDSTAAPAQPSPAPTTDPESWKKVDPTLAGLYRAETSTTVHDIDGRADDKQLIRGQEVRIAGTFTRVVRGKKVEYFITEKSVAQGNWRGIPKICLKPLSLKRDDNDELFDQLLDNAKFELQNAKLPGSKKQKAIKALATSEAKKVGWFGGLFSKNKEGAKK